MDKARGSDGLNALFYKKAWDIIKEEVCASIVNFFNFNCFQEAIHWTTLATQFFNLVVNKGSYHTVFLATKHIQRIWEVECFS